MPELGSELERRSHPRERPGARCWLFLAGERYDATVLDVSRGGLFVQCDAPAWPGALVRLTSRDRDRHAIVVRERSVSRQLRGILPRGFGLRWVESRPAA